MFTSVIGCAAPDGDEVGAAPLEVEAQAQAATLNGFVDACALPGMTKATFNATSGFDAIDEGVTAAMNLPFSFTFYGTSHTKYWITTNGQLGFGNTPGGSLFGQVSCPLPSAGFSTPIVLVYSTDLITRVQPDFPTGPVKPNDPNFGVCYATTGTAPNRKHVVTWKDSFFYEGWNTSHVTFSATLNESSNIIDVAIGLVDSPNMPDFETGWISVLGKQSGSSAYAYSCHQPTAPEGTIVSFNP